MDSLSTDNKLTSEEQIELDLYRRSGKPDLSIQTSLKLYELWVQGISCQEIAKLNPGLSLGCVLKARVDHKWDERRDCYLAELYSNANSRLSQIAGESLNFLGLTLAAAHKQFGEKLSKYLVSGNPEDLGPFQIQSLAQYKSVIETIARLTGQDQKRQVTVSGEVRQVAVTSSALTPEQADLMRAKKLLK